MQIVIDLPDYLYDRLHDLVYDDYALNDYELAVFNGTPLPKGHGRLIDADSMKTIKNIQSANFNAVALIRLWIDKQTTIIEADKAESEEV